MRNRKLVELFGTLGGTDMTLVNESVGEYTTAIFVPELATRLIMEDMGLADDKIAEGRKLMVDTVDLGNIINPEKIDEDVLNDYSDEYNAEGDGAGGMAWWWDEQVEKARREDLGIHDDDEEWLDEDLL